MSHDLMSLPRAPIHQTHDRPCVQRDRAHLHKAHFFKALIAPPFIIMMICLGLNTQEASARSNDFTKAAKIAMPAVVSIQVIKRSKLPAVSSFEEEFLRHFFGPSFPGPQGGGKRPGQKRPGGEQQGQGSGFIISEDGYILTNNHVVGGADEILVQTADGRSLKAKLIGADDKSDVAVIKVDEESLPELTIGDSSQLEIGEWVLAVGNPFGLSATLTVGVVSATGRAGMGITDYEEFIQTDAAINPGNSGGPLLNIDGQVIGINTAIYSRSGGYMGIGFAIPINMALKIKDQLIAFGEVRRGRIGAYIQELTPEIAQRFGVSDKRGVLIADIVPDSPADRGGLHAGDIVVELDQRPISTAAMFRNRISLTEPQSVVKLKIFRDGEERDIKVQIGALNANAESAQRSKSAQSDSKDEYGL
jgi:serine protease Do